MKNTMHQQSVMLYYDLVDKADYPAMYLLFADDIVYQRCEQRIDGMTAFRQFYEADRHIVGKHTIHQSYTDKQTVITRGVFNGKNSRDDTITLTFSDFFEFDNNGKIVRRDTYLANGYQLTT